MGEEGLRRSTRARKQVKSYAEEQAEQQEAIIKPARKKRSRATDDSDDEAEVAAPKRKAARKNKSKKSSATVDEESDSDDESSANKIKNRRKKPTLYPVSKEKETEWMNDASSKRVAQRIARIPKLAADEEETRLKSYQDELPDWYEKYLKNASTQKMFVLERNRDVEEDCHAGHEDCPCETLKIAGSKGNIYTIRISHLCTCNCPVAIFSKKGQEKQCKHVLYVLHHVLRAAEHLKYQAAFLTSELRELFANAPPLPDQIIEDEPMDGNRKEVSGECPICFMDFEEGEDVVWCRAACGNNIHKGCFQQWANMKARVTCPFCRTEWQNEETKKPAKAQKTTVAKVTDKGKRDGGYMNVRDQLEYD